MKKLRRTLPSSEYISGPETRNSMCCLISAIPLVCSAENSSRPKNLTGTSLDPLERIVLCNRDAVCIVSPRVRRCTIHPTFHCKSQELALQTEDGKPCNSFLQLTCDFRTSLLKKINKNNSSQADKCKMEKHIYRNSFTCERTYSTVQKS